LTGKQRGFIAAFSVTGSVRFAAKAAKVHRASHPRWLQQSAEYREAFADAVEDATDALEEEAFRRAHAGVPRLVHHKGVPMNHPETGAPLWERQYSDVLLIFLWRALRPEKYRER
jgi:hypothetical protein